MSLEYLREELLAMLNEAENLPESELSPVEGTNIKVKTGRVSEFKSKARNYYERYFNHTLTDAEEATIPYLKEAYETLVANRTTSSNEYFFSLVEEITSANKDLTERFAMLNRSLTTIESQYQMLQAKSDVLSRSNLSDAEFTQKSDELKNELSELASNKMRVVRDILKTKEEINNRFVETIKDQLELLENNFTNTRNTVKPEWATNGVPVLPNEFEEYEALLKLLKLNNTIDTSQKLVCVKGVFCVPESSLKEVNDLFSKTKLFSILNSSREEHLNTTMLAEIDKAIANIRESFNPNNLVTTAQDGYQINQDDEPEYNRLLELRKIVERGEEKVFPTGERKEFPVIVNVWNKAYVNRADRIKFEALMRASKTFKKDEPNAELIAKIEKQIDSLAAKITNHKGLYNLKIRQTDTLEESEDKKQDAKVWVVLEADLAECNRLINIIKILRKQHGEYLHKTWGGAYVDKSKLADFKKFANGTEFFAGYIPKLVENDNEITKIKDRLAELIKRAKDNPNEPMASNGLVLQEDEEEYNLLNRQYTLLESAKAAAETETVNGVKVPKGKGNEYQAAATILDNKRKRQTPPKKELNEEKIQSILERMQKILTDEKAADPSLPRKEVAGYTVLESDAPEFELLATLGSILQNANESTNLVEIDDVKVDAAVEDLYRKTADALAELQKSKGVSMSSSIKPPISRDFEENKKEIARLYNMLSAIITASYGDKVEELEYTSDKKVVNKDLLNEYELIKELIDILKSSMEAENLSEYGNLKIASDSLARYQEIENLLKERKEELKLIKERKDILDRAQTSKDLIEINGIGIDSKDADRYLEIIDNLNDIKKARNKAEKKEEKAQKREAKKAKRQKVSIKGTLESMKKDGIKKNLKRIAVAGLIGAVSGIALSGGLAAATIAVLGSSVPSLGLAGFGTLTGGSIAGLKLFHRKKEKTKKEKKEKQPKEKISIYETPRNIHTETERVMMQSNFDAFRASDQLAQEMMVDASLNPDNEELQEAIVEAQENVLTRYNELKDLLDAYNRENQPISINSQELIETLDTMGGEGTSSETASNSNATINEEQLKNSSTEELEAILKSFQEELNNNPDDEIAKIFISKITKILDDRKSSLTPPTPEPIKIDEEKLKQSSTEELEQLLNSLQEELNKNPDNELAKVLESKVNQILNDRRSSLTPPAPTPIKIDEEGLNKLSNEELGELFDSLKEELNKNPDDEMAKAIANKVVQIISDRKQDMGDPFADDNPTKKLSDEDHKRIAAAIKKAKPDYGESSILSQSDSDILLKVIRKAEEIINNSSASTLTDEEIERIVAESLPTKTEEQEPLRIGNAPSLADQPEDKEERLKWLKKKAEEYREYIEKLQEQLAYASPEAEALYKPKLRESQAAYGRIKDEISKLENELDAAKSAKIQFPALPLIFYADLIHTNIEEDIKGIEKNITQWEEYLSQLEALKGNVPKEQEEEYNYLINMAKTSLARQNEEKKKLAELATKNKREPIRFPLEPEEFFMMSWLTLETNLQKINEIKAEWEEYLSQLEALKDKVPEEQEEEYNNLINKAKASLESLNEEKKKLEELAAAENKQKPIQFPPNPEEFMINPLQTIEENIQKTNETKAEWEEYLSQLEALEGNVPEKQKDEYNGRILQARQVINALNIYTPEYIASFLPSEPNKPNQVINWPNEPIKINSYRTKSISDAVTSIEANLAEWEQYKAELEAMNVPQDNIVDYSKKLDEANDVINTLKEIMELYNAINEPLPEFPSLPDNYLNTSLYIEVLNLLYSHKDELNNYMNTINNHPGLTPEQKESHIIKANQAIADLDKEIANAEIEAMREESYRGLSVNNLEILIENNRKAPPNEVGLRNIEAMQRVKDYKEKYGDGLPTISTTTSSAAEALETLVQKNNDLDRQVADVTSRMAKIQEYTRKAEEAASKGDDEAAAKYAELASELEFGQNLDGEDGSLQPPSGRR